MLPVLETKHGFSLSLKSHTGCCFLVTNKEIFEIARSLN